MLTMRRIIGFYKSCWSTCIEAELYKYICRIYYYCLFKMYKYRYPDMEGLRGHADPGM